MNEKLEKKVFKFSNKILLDGKTSGSDKLNAACMMYTNIFESMARGVVRTGHKEAIDEIIVMNQNISNRLSERLVEIQIESNSNVASIFKNRE